jgi:hypothetical protein
MQVRKRTCLRAETPLRRAGMGDPRFKASDGGRFDVLWDRGNFSQSEFQRGHKNPCFSTGRPPEAIPTGSLMPVLLSFLQYLGF